MSPIRDTTGYLVADAGGRKVGRVECPLYGRTETLPDSLAVCSSGRLFRRHYIVRRESIRAIDRHSRSIRLGLDQRELQRFL
jgi:hypothetical protein